jgi:transcriptional regulator with XRE-family HTH domain
MLRIKELRESRGLSIRALAAATGFSHSTILRAEKGERKLSTPQAVAIARYFGVSADYLLGHSPGEMLNNFINSMRNDFLTETMHSDGDVTQSLADSIPEPVRTKIEILFVIQEISNKKSLDLILDLAKLKRAQEDFSSPLAGDKK